MVTLKQLVGKRPGATGLETIYQPIDGVYLDGRHVGWIDRMTGARLSFIRNLPVPQYIDVHKAVCKLREEAGEFGPPDAKFQAVAEVPDEVLAKYAAEALGDDEDTEEDGDE